MKLVIALLKAMSFRERHEVWQRFCHCGCSCQIESDE